MSIVDELKALGVSDDYCVYVERLTSQDFTLAELVLPLVLELGYQAAVNKRLASKVLQLERELEVKNKRLADWLKEKLEREGVNQRKNQYVTQLREWLARAEKEAADTKRAYDALKGRMSCVEKEAADTKRAYDARKNVTFETRHAVDGAALPASYYAQRPMGLGCKVPEPEQPYVRYQDKKSWAIGDRVRITEDLAGTVRHISYGERLGAHTVGILTDTKGDVQTTHWLIRKSSLHSLEYRGQYTTQVQK